MDERKLHQLLDMQEHPEQFTDEELAEMLSDHEGGELLEATALLKRAMIHEQHRAARPSQRRWPAIAASIIGILFVSGIAFAAIHYYIEHSTLNNDKSPTVFPEGTADKGQSSMFIVPSDTIPTGPKVFDNVTLGEMLPEIAEHYGLTVQFQSEQTRQLRFYFKWNPDSPVGKVVEELNMFEQVNLKLNDQSIIAE